MPTIHLHQTTTLTSERYVAGLTDFEPGRSKLYGNSADEYLKVHDRGRTQADVTEVSGSNWEGLHYDWSDPNHVVLTTTDIVEDRDQLAGAGVEVSEYVHTGPAGRLCGLDPELVREQAGEELAQ